MMLLDIMDFFRKGVENPSFLFNPKELIQVGGFIILLLMVFAETGIFFCFFFPGDSLVFTAGVLTATRDLNHNVFVVIAAMVIAATLGNLSGFFFGKRLGPGAYKRKESWFFKKEYLKMADDFYGKYGGLALMAGRFFPIIRTFAPIVAGIIKVDFKKFLFFSFAGAVTWVAPLVTAGYFLGKIPFVEKNLGYIIIGFIIVITSPVIIRFIRESKKMKS
jgi:membrane-associated protein